MKREERNKLIKYMSHLPTCNTMQDWTEAEAAFADTPTHLRDGDWNEARHEMDLKRNTCTCGFEDAIESLFIPPDAGKPRTERE